MRESCFSEKLSSFKFFCASLILMYIRNKRSLTSVDKTRKIPIYFFDFLKDNAMVHVCGNLLFTAYLYQILEGVGEGGGTISNSIM